MFLRCCTVCVLALLAPASTSNAAGPPPPPSAPAYAQPSPSLVRRAGQVIERLRQAPGPAERDALVADLVDMGPDVLSLVQAEFDRRSPTTWGQMVHVMGAIGDPRVIPTLRRELGHQTDRVYMEVLYALALAGDPDAPLQALRSPSARAGFTPDATAMDFIAGALGPRLVPMLVREIPKRTADARVAGLGALATIGDTQPVPFLLEWSRQQTRGDRRGAVMALARIGAPQGVPRVIESLDDPDPLVQQAAAEGAGYLRDARAVPGLLKIARQPAPSPLRTAAYWSLGLIGGGDASAALVAALSRNDLPDDDRLMVIRALGQTGDRSAVAALLREARSASPLHAGVAVKSLTALPRAATADAMLEICTDGTVHEAGLDAARALVARRDPRGSSCAVRRLRDEIRLRNGLDPVAEELLDQLPLAAPASTASSLESLAETIGAPALQHRVLQAAQLIRMVAEKGASVKPWLEVLDGGTPPEVDLSIERLAELGDPAAVEPLVRLFGRIEPERAWRIPVALGRLGGTRVTPALVAFLADDLYRVPSLARAREEAARALASQPPSAQAAEALKKAYLADGGRSVIPLLAFARVRGAAGIGEILELKVLLMRHRGNLQPIRHERVNWAVRMLRLGREIPLDEIVDPQ